MKNYIPVIIISMVLYSSCKHPDEIPANAKILCQANYSVFHSGDSVPVIISYQSQVNYPRDSIFLLSVWDISADSSWQITTLNFADRTADTIKIKLSTRGNSTDTIGIITCFAYSQGTIGCGPQCYVVIEP